MKLVEYSYALMFIGSLAIWPGLIHNAVQYSTNTNKEFVNMNKKLFFFGIVLFFIGLVIFIYDAAHDNYPVPKYAAKGPSSPQQYIN